MAILRDGILVKALVKEGHPALSIHVSLECRRAICIGGTMTWRGIDRGD
jgi:hypothetical protein